MATEKIINLSKRVTIVGTGKSVFMPKGKEFKVHPLNAEHLVKAGKATIKTEKPEKAEL